MEKFFNNAGPSVSGKHYIIDPLERIDVNNISGLIAQERYFVLHAPRQTGKTTCLLALMHHLNAQGDYTVLYTNIEAAQASRNDIKTAMTTICYAIAHRAETYLNDTRLLDKVDDFVQKNAAGALTELLSYWARINDKPTVLLLDEVDALVGNTLISFLRQIRAGYAQRPSFFPQAIILCGVRDVRDYRIHTPDQQIITGGSAFNIKAASLRLGNLSKTEVIELWQQHTTETGQVFEDSIFAELWQDTEGQPWLVNALGYTLTWETRRLRDRSITITLEDYWQARETLIRSRATHLDQLTDKLQEKRVHQVIAALLSSHEGDDIPPLSSNNVRYVIDLGLAQVCSQLRISNRIYQEVITRLLKSHNTLHVHS